MKNVLLLLAIISNLYTTAQDLRATRLDGLFTSLHAKNAFNGNVLIAEEGKTLFEKSYGYADEISKRAIDKNTVFELASVSKQFTAMAIVLLQKQGKLRYEDHIATYIPSLSFYKDITIRQLIHHTSGLPDYMELFEEKWAKSTFATNQDVVDMLAKYKPALQFQPDEKFEYSNTGYALLGFIIEKTSQMTFEDFLKQHIFKPLKMNNTFVYRSRFKPQKVENYALGYVQDSMGNKVLTNSFGKTFYTYYLDGIVGDGMVNSTASDLLIWDQALYTNALVNETDKKTIFESIKTIDGATTDYGFGWFITQQENYGAIANHSGGWAGYTTFIERHMTSRKTIILLQNHSLPTTALPIKHIRNILYNEPIITDKQITLTTAQLSQFTGVYTNPDFPLKITVSQEGNTLYTQATGQQAIPMDAYENNVFKFDSAGIRLTFYVENGTMRLQQNGANIIFTKQ